MRRFASVGIVLAIACAQVALSEGAASARGHRHRRGHRPGRAACGPGTSKVGGVCTSTPPTAPTPGKGNSNVTIVPSSVQLSAAGQFVALAVVTGLPPGTRVPAPPELSCGPAAKIRVVVPAGNNVNTEGRLEATVQDNGGAGGCYPGNYPIVFAETGPPYATFTGFITLHR